ncbi:MAG: histidine phosphatase family protein [Xanthomonadales bacterium]|nr:histidine phosphatase family protein [Xanthomonadales bacterium]
MQTLMIFRHAKAVPWDSMPDDFSRPLNEVGVAHAAAVAGWMEDHGEFPGMVLCSPSQRTRETLAPLLETCERLEQRTRFLPQLYGASAHTLVNVLDHAFAESDSVMVVGHNPGLEQLVFDCTSAAHREGIKRLATGTLVIISFEPDWAEAQGRGRVGHRVRGKKLLA